MNILKWFLGVCIGVLWLAACGETNYPRIVDDFNQDWYFQLGDIKGAEFPNLDHANWRQLDLPHDWSIEGEFSAEHPATAGGGALPGGIGWYRKSFQLDESLSQKNVFVQFDGVYMNSEVWINGTYLGKRPFGYISFEYDLTPYLHFGKEANVIAVKVDNSQQPNSRWYSGSGIYRNTRLVFKEDIFVSLWGTYVTTPEISPAEAKVTVETNITSRINEEQTVEVLSSILDTDRRIVSSQGVVQSISEGQSTIKQDLNLSNPHFWNLDDPYLYTLLTEIKQDGQLIDQYETTFGVRQFVFDQQSGFSLNGLPVKIKGVCNHHDLGCLGTAVNTRAIQRQLEILRGMGVNAIRTAHNPPAPELLDLCDQMGFLVMDETFDIWSMKKSPYDYSLYWDEWHQKDLTDHILRDRNHASIIMWSTGNEVLEQWGDQGPVIAKELYDIVKDLDTTRPITIAMNPPVNMSHKGVTTQFDVHYNSISQSEGIDLIGYNYAHQTYSHHTDNFPDKSFIATETTSGLATRGYYSTQSDTLKRWPIRWDIPFDQGNPGNTVSAYDQVSTPWGSTHEETWKVLKKFDYLSGMFIWTGFDYLGEPTPYTWPSRSSYFGVVDLAGFPKDSYYMYQSEWTQKEVLHVLPHWNWSDRDSVDVWAYFTADEVELFLNGKSLGTKEKEGDELHVMWRVAYEPGELKAVSRSTGQTKLEKVIKTAGAPVSIQLTPDRAEIAADGSDLSFVTVEALDASGYPVPVADNLVTFSVSGNGKIVGVNNGDPTSHLSLKGSEMKIFNGKCLVVLQSDSEVGTIVLKAESEGLQSAVTNIQTK